MRRMLLLLPVLACAPLDRARMSERCRGLYDACLNGCPMPAGGLNPTQPDDQRFAGGDSWQIVYAECTDRCNKEARRCE